MGQLGASGTLHWFFCLRVSLLKLFSLLVCVRNVAGTPCTDGSPLRACLPIDPPFSFPLVVPPNSLMYPLCG